MVFVVELDTHEEPAKAVWKDFEGCFAGVLGVFEFREFLGIPSVTPGIGRRDPIAPHWT